MDLKSTLNNENLVDFKLKNSIKTQLFFCKNQGLFKKKPMILASKLNGQEPGHVLSLT